MSDAAPPEFDRGLVRKKSLGQHFLHDGAILSKIVTALGPLDGEHVLEIGPGTGRLTARLCERVGPERLVCLEFDRDMIAHLGAKLPEVAVLHGDAATFDYEALRPGTPMSLAANLPYNASTAILFHILQSHRARFRRLVVMLQREVAERLLATPGKDGKAYGPPSVFITALCDARPVCRVPPRAFRPPPRVDSMVIALDPLATPRFGLTDAELPRFQRFVRACFEKRRKTLHNNLRAVTSDSAAFIAAAGLAADVRAEVVPAGVLVSLWRAVVANAA